MDRKYTLAVAGLGYVGLSIAVLLSQHHKVFAVDVVPEKIDLVNNRKSPIQDNYIEKYLAEKELDLTATLNAEEAYSNAKTDISQTCYCNSIFSVHAFPSKNQFINHNKTWLILKYFATKLKINENITHSLELSYDPLCYR